MLKVSLDLKRCSTASIIRGNLCISCYSRVCLCQAMSLGGGPFQTTRTVFICAVGIAVVFIDLTCLPPALAPRSGLGWWPGCPQVCPGSYCLAARARSSCCAMRFIAEHNCTTLITCFNTKNHTDAIQTRFTMTSFGLHTTAQFLRRSTQRYQRT